MIIHLKMNFGLVLLMIGILFKSVNEALTQQLNRSYNQNIRACFYTAPFFRGQVACSVSTGGKCAQISPGRRIGSILLNNGDCIKLYETDNCIDPTTWIGGSSMAPRFYDLNYVSRESDRGFHPLNLRVVRSFRGCSWLPLKEMSEHKMNRRL